MKFPSKMRDNWKNREKISLINYASKFWPEEKWVYDSHKNSGFVESHWFHYGLPKKIIRIQFYYDRL